MSYNLGRALGISFLLYVATFVVGIVSGIVSGQDMSSLDTVSDSFWYVGMVGAVVLCALFATWYLNGKNISASAASGLKFGITAVILSSGLDLILFSLGNAAGASTDLGRYYGDLRFWIILLLVVGTAALMGYWKQKKS